jgi:hypothetical protein
MNSPVIGGAISSKADYRDGIAAASIPVLTAPITLPPTYQTDFSRFGIFNQAKIPACVSHEWAALMKLWWFRTHGEVVDFSPRYLDILSSEPDIPLDGGRRPRTVAKIAATMGCATTATVPNDTTLPITEYRYPSVITDAAKAEAAKYKIPGYLRVPLDLMSLRAHTMLYGAVSTLMLIGDEFWTPSWADKDIDPLRPPQSVVGGHQTLTKGWKNWDMNTLRNSWGNDWANHGEADWSYANWKPYLIEAWTIAEIPTDVTDFLHTLPTAANFHYQWHENLRYGDQNEDTMWLQVALIILGYLDPLPAAQLGYFGPKTAAAVGKYQTAHGIFPVPDSVGPLTRAALCAQFPIKN